MTVAFSFSFIDIGDFFINFCLNSFLLFSSFLADCKKEKELLLDGYLVFLYCLLSLA